MFMFFCFLTFLVYFSHGVVLLTVMINNSTIKEKRKFTSHIKSLNTQKKKKHMAFEIQVVT
jgi:hypothetical protein